MVKEEQKVSNLSDKARELTESLNSNLSGRSLYLLRIGITSVVFVLMLLMAYSIGRGSQADECHKTRLDQLEQRMNMRDYRG